MSNFVIGISYQPAFLSCLEILKSCLKISISTFCSILREKSGFVLCSSISFFKIFSIDQTTFPVCREIIKIEKKFGFLLLLK